MYKVASIGLEVPGCKYQGVSESRESNLLLFITFFCSLFAGVDIFVLAPINIVEINKQFDKTWKGVRKIRHF